MEKNIPGLKKAYRKHLAKLRTDQLTIGEANRLVRYWDSKYRQLVTSGDSFDAGDGVYGAILDAYAKREALKQYIEEVEENDTDGDNE